eukprot:scaffold175617_cov35-Tisochrysis_lutea.AAC.1
MRWVLWSLDQITLALVHLAVRVVPPTPSASIAVPMEVSVVQVDRRLYFQPHPVLGRHCPIAPSILAFSMQGPPVRLLQLEEAARLELAEELLLQPQQGFPQARPLLASASDATLPTGMPRHFYIVGMPAPSPRTHVEVASHQSHDPRTALRATLGLGWALIFV